MFLQINLQFTTCALLTTNTNLVARNKLSNHACFHWLLTRMLTNKLGDVSVTITKKLSFVYICTQNSEASQNFFINVFT